MNQGSAQLGFAKAPVRTGLRLQYAEQGDAAGEAIIFLHGFSARNHVMEELAEAVRGLEDPIPREFVQEFQSGAIARPVPAEFMETVMAESLKLPAHVWHAYMERVILAPDPAARLDELDVPTLVMWGELPVPPGRHLRTGLPRMRSCS